MAVFDVFELRVLVFTVVASFLVALAALLVVSRFINPRQAEARALSASSEESAIFLFDDEWLVDATRYAHYLLQAGPAEASDWSRFLSAVRPRFPDIASELSFLAQRGAVSIPSADPQDTSRIEAEWWGGLARIELVDEAATDGDQMLDRTSLVALEDELVTLRATVAHAPQLVWQEASNGDIVWANAAYLATAQRICAPQDVDVWPLPRFFDLSPPENIMPESKAKRVSVTSNQDGGVFWFDRTAVKLGESVLCFAVPADRSVRAENTLREFVQTLTKTFAHLPIGLAIFDRNRQLALFNPALTDLTALPFEFLSAHPTLYTFLDRMREKRMMPEPKDYKSWREQMTDLEAAATSGEYEETWALPSGQTYRVTGRPHPEGAVAFLFEDISSEVSLTRQFRMELETGQAVIDALSDAIAVFAPSGVLTLSNTAYAELWGVDPSTSFGEMSIVDATRSWQNACEPTPAWGDAREFIQGLGERSEWSSNVVMTNGRKLSCNFVPLSAGATLVSFSDAQPGSIRTDNIKKTGITASAT